MSDTAAQLGKLLELLKIEQEEDRSFYREKILHRSLQERKQQGVTWYPVIIKESYYGVGERLHLEIERPTSQDIPNQFQTGRVASLFSNYTNEGRDNPALSGVVSAVRPNGLKITFFTDELPEWIDSGKLGIDLMFDETSYKEMEIAVSKVTKARNNRLAELREVILGSQTPGKEALNFTYNSFKLNAIQNEAVSHILSSKDLAIVHGPPGTGKTTTLVQAIVETIKKEKRVLVCAASNTAVDLLTEKLFQQGLNVLRFGNPARVNEEMLAHTMDMKVAAHREFKRIKELRKTANEYKVMAQKYKRNFGYEERQQRKLVLNEAKKLQAEAGELENFIIQDLIEKAQVITCTLVGSASYMLRDMQFPTVFIDEAAQALEPACWIPITRADRVVFAGDHCQLPPTIKSKKAAKEGLELTLFEKCIQNGKLNIMLETQYRMHQKIMDFSSQVFYQGKLKADDLVKDHVLDSFSENPLLTDPVTFIDTAGCSFGEESEGENMSTYNPEEANLLLKHLNSVYECLNGELTLHFKTGIISPYKAQVNLLKSKLDEYPLLYQNKNISINTIDGFQGQERDIIYISLVRSNGDGEIGFLSDIRRMNVALTRAKKKLVVIGDSATLSKHKFYNEFLLYVDKINAYKSAWEFI